MGSYKKKQEEISFRYYYNWGRILHAFSADDAGYKKMQSNGIGYDPTNGAGEDTLNYC